MCDKRKDGENFREYKTRLRLQNAHLALYIKGRVIWDSKKQGTYRRPA